MPDDSSTFLTTEELAERHRTTPAAIAARRYRGEGPPALKVGKRLLYRLDLVEKWERVNTEGAPRLYNSRTA